MDVIERQAAIDIVNCYAEQLDGYIGMPNDSEVYAYARGLLLSIHRNISALQSAQPERKKGKKIVKSNGMMGYWICDQCNEPLHPDDNFCPNCGADMREETNAV